MCATAGSVARSAGHDTVRRSALHIPCSPRFQQGRLDSSPSTTFCATEPVLNDESTILSLDANLPRKCTRSTSPSDDGETQLGPAAVMLMLNCARGWMGGGRADTGRLMRGHGHGTASGSAWCGSGPFDAALTNGTNKQIDGMNGGRDGPYLDVRLIIDDRRGI